MLSESNRVHQIDKKFDADVSNEQFMNQLFVRLVAKDKQFTKVDFKYSIFDTCYLRGCKFDSCDFTGCRFVGTNLHGAKFSGCKFDYSIFERTVVENPILDTECPGSENLKMKFARTLRMNYQQLGDAESVNKAIRIELQVTEIHLHKAWGSNEAYYRKKYAGLKRLEKLLEWINFKFFDLVWGNGENPLKLLLVTIIILMLMSLIDVWKFKNTQIIDSYTQAFLGFPQIFLGTLSPSYYPSLYLVNKLGKLRFVASQ
ncbi:pentapeptide repeat-containing protein [Scytonema sp. NUACC26]|uniref:pentapeptide repeat-containing protein n=1 Tax=Scytonema sp. NUACC26 TaxID=3140176 RepID=UPI0034DC9E33